MVVFSVQSCGCDERAFFFGIELKHQNALLQCSRHNAIPPPPPPPPMTYWTIKRRELVTWRAWVVAARQMMLSHHASYAVTLGEHSNCDWLLIMRCFISLIWKILSAATCLLFVFFFSFFFSSQLVRSCSNSKLSVIKFKMSHLRQWLKVVDLRNNLSCSPKLQRWFQGKVVSFEHFKLFYLFNVAFAI